MENQFKIFVLSALLVLGISVAGSTFFVIKTLKNSNSASQETVSQEGTSRYLKEVEVGEAIVTNIISEGSVQHVVKIQIKLGVDGSKSKEYEAFVNQLEERSASVRNELINTIGEQTYTMLSDTKAGKEKLADEIIVRLNRLLETELIQAVYYEEYFVQ